jgi:hypothetical protein
MQSSVGSRQSSVLSGCPPQRFDKSCEHSFDLYDVFFRRPVAHRGNQSKIAREQKKIFDLARGAHGKVEKPSKFNPGASSTTFRDICGDRARCATQLRSEPKAFVLWKSAGYVVNEQRELMALLPHAQLAKVLHTASYSLVLLTTDD